MEKEKFYRRNGEIRGQKVMVIQDSGDSKVLFLNEALNFAGEQELDLVEVGFNTVKSMPVCKVMDYGAFIFKEKKKQQENAKKNKELEIKEVRLRPVTDEGDFSTKLKQIVGFLEKGHRVRVAVKFKGREITHADAGLEMIDRVSEAVNNFAVKENDAKMDGKQLIGLFAPSKKAKKM